MPAFSKEHVSWRSCIRAVPVCDVHAGSVTACARMATGAEVTYDHRTVSTTTPGLPRVGRVAPAHGCTHVAMEATGVYWKPVWHVLEAHFTLILANAMHIRNVPGRKSDMNDATWIADLLAHGLIRSSFVPPAPIQELRDLTRTRRQLVHEVARHVLRIQKTLEGRQPEAHAGHERHRRHERPSDPQRAGRGRDPIPIAWSISHAGA